MQSIQFVRHLGWITGVCVPMAACTMATHSEDFLSSGELSPLDGIATVTSKEVTDTARNGQFTGWNDSIVAGNIQVSPDGAIALVSESKGNNSWKIRLMAPLENGIELDSSGKISNFDIDQLLQGPEVNVTANAITVHASTTETCPVGAMSALTFDPRAGNAAIRVASESDCNAASPALSPTGAFSCHKLLVYAEAECSNAVYIAVAPLQVVTTYGSDPAIQTANLGTFNVIREEPADAAIPIESGTDSTFRNHLTATADGRLVVFWRFGTGMLYTYSDDPTNGTGFSAPKSLWDIDGENRTVTRDGRVLGFADVYPIAKNEIKFPDGTPKATTTEGCGYPWIAPDGSDIFCNAGELSALVTFGQSTKGYIKHVDSQVQTTQATYCNKISTNACTPPQAACSDSATECNGTVGIENTTSLGTATGFWVAPSSSSSAEPKMPMNRRSSLRYMVARNSALKYFGTDPLKQSDGFVFFEVANDDFSDPNFDVFLHMNEAILPKSPALAKFDKDNPFARNTSPTTADTSGNGYIGILDSGAQFPFEYYGEGESNATNIPGSSGPPNPGFLGRAIHFPSSGTVVFGPGGTAISSHQSFTLELAVKPESALSNGTRGTTFVNAPGAFTLRIGGNGFLRFDVHNQFASWAVPLPTSTWTHLTLTYEVLPGTGRDAKVKLYKNGTQLASEKTLSFNVAADIPAMDGDAVNPSMGILCVGPGCTTTAGYADAALWIDELAISNVVRSDEYIAAAAFSSHTVPGIDAARSIAEFPALLPNGIPSGLEAQDLRIPTPVLDLFASEPTLAGKQAKFAAISSLGQSLFQDDILTFHIESQNNVRNSGRSCATCHVPTDAFAKTGEQFAPSVTNSPTHIDKNTPTIVNRAFSIQQFLDKRAPDLLAQVLVPVENQFEMGGDISVILEQINNQNATSSVTGQSYLAWFRSAFGDPNMLVTRDTLAQALTIWILGRMAGGSDVDKIRAGNTTITNAAQISRGLQVFEGKGRCTACHTGANYSDERLHTTVQDGVRIKTPTLRRIKKTHPYLHDGSKGNLDQVIDFYDQGGCRADGCDTELFPLGLTTAEKADLKAFLVAL